MALIAAAALKRASSNNPIKMPMAEIKPAHPSQLLNCMRSSPWIEFRVRDTGYFSTQRAAKPCGLRSHGYFDLAHLSPHG